MTILSQQNLAQLIFASVARNRTRRAIATMENSATYDQLEELIINFAQHMSQNGIRRGARVALAGDHPIIMIALTIACSLVGCSWIRSTALAFSHPALRITHVVHLGPRPKEARVPGITVDPSWTSPPRPLRGAPPVVLAGYANPRDAWMVAASSGTTGASKYIALSEEIIWHRAHGGIGSHDAAQPTVLSLFPNMSWFSTITALRTLIAGGTLLVGDLAALFGHVPIDTVVGSPFQYMEFMDAVPPGETRIPEAVVAGAPAGAPFFRRLQNYFGQVVNNYGSTETSMLCAKALAAAEMESENLPAGKAAAGVTIEIVDENGRALPPGTEGIVRARSAAMVSAYIGEPGLSAHIFRGGWFHSGDLGMLSLDGELCITGRANDILNIGGAKLNPEVIENIIRAHEGVRDAACLPLPGADGIDRLVAAICLNGPVDVRQIAPAIREAVAARVGPAGVPRALYVLDRIPRNANGKIARGELVAAVHAKQGFDVVAE